MGDKGETRRWTWWMLSAVLLGMALMAGPATRAQQEQTSLGDIARKLRAEKKPAQAKTYTNENLPRNESGISIVGLPPAEEKVSPEKTEKQQPAEARPTPEASKEQLELEHQLEEALKQRDQLAKELDLSQRDYALAQQQLAQNPNFKDDRGGQANLAALRQAIDEQKDALEKLNQHIAELQQKLDALNKGQEPQKPPQP